ncbi:MAG: hypothetical protein HYT31_02895 [Parcubacteria group bacterium]|nr:hypothetical protein [Parcubacteria group bacterium]
MRERKLFLALCAAALGTVSVFGCGFDPNMGVPDDDPSHTGETMVPPVRTVWDRDTAGVSAPLVERAAPAAESALPVHGGVEVPGWNTPNGTYHEVVYLDISASLSEEERDEAAAIVRDRILAVSGANKVTVRLVGTSYVPWPTAASDSGRAVLAAMVKDYLTRHAFGKAETAYTNYALPLLTDMENGFIELKESGIRFHATIVGDGWNDEPAGQDSWFFQEALQECMSRVPQERKGMFSVELVSVNTRDMEYPGEVHLRSLFGNADFPVYPAGSWADVRKRFEAIDRELNGSYSWANLNEPARILVSGLGEMYLAGVYELLLDAPTRASGELFTAVLVADSENSSDAAHVLGFWKIRGSESEPIPFSEGLVIPDKAEVEVFVAFNEESPPPGDVLWPLSRPVPCKVKLVPHGSVSLTERGNRPAILAERRAWLYRDWIPDKLLGIAAILVFAVAMLFVAARRMRAWSEHTVTSRALPQDTSGVVGHIACNGQVRPIRSTWFEVRNIAVVPTPNGIYIGPRVPCSMFPLSGSAAGIDRVPMQPGKMYPLVAQSVQILDAVNQAYQVDGAVVPSVAADSAVIQPTVQELSTEEVYI